MTFAVPEAYDRFMGRYSVPLAPRFADFAGVAPGARVLDVGAGPGALAKELARRVGAARVATADPSEPFVQACRARLPGADARVAAAEKLPWADGSFDAVLSQLVVNFLRDAGAGAREMRRVARPGGVAAACTWDRGPGVQMLHVFGEAARALDAAALRDAPAGRCRDADELRALWQQAGFSGVETEALEVEAEYQGFDDYWAGFLTGIGPDSAYCLSLAEGPRAALREECRRRLGSPAGAFGLRARAWAVRGRA
ncbi:MAG TPA: class I SAM-dependent methyltransferase [Anaeromyxobacteraceae bacterium]|nr:class I SAM-dependent methyltransferase [Anaeromyxobacteraceae bacterium]